MKKYLLCIFNSIKKFNKKYEDFINSNKYKRIFQFLPHNFFILILFVITLCIFIPQIISNDVRVYNSSIPNEVIEPIIYEKIEEEINVKKVEEFNAVSILFATYDRENDSIYRFDLYKDDKKIYSEKFNAKMLSDNQYYDFKVDKVKVDRNSSYKISISPIKVDKNNCITLYSNKTTDTISFRLLNTSPWYNIVIICFIIFLISFFVINYLINNNKIKSEKSFLLIMLFYIISILFITPALEIPDETYHFYKSYGLSKYNFSEAPADNLYKPEISVSKNIKCLYYADAEAKDNVDDIDKFISCFSNSKEKKYEIPANVSNTQTLFYIPSAVAIKIISIFTNAPIILFYVGRIVNFVIGFLLLLWAIKIIPKYKKLLLLIVCIPMFVQQLISYSYDSLLNSCAILLITYFVKFYNQKEQIDTKELIIYFILSFLMLHIKFPYFILSLLIFLIPTKKFKNGLKSKLVSIGLLYGVTILLYFVINKLVSIGNIPSSAADQFINQGANKQLSYLLSNPKSIIKVAFMTLKTKGIGYLQSLIGCFGWLKFNLHYIFVWSYYIIFSIVVVSSKSMFKNSKLKIYILILISAIIAIVFGGMYLTWTDYMLPYVEGVQGRYFIPILFPLLLILIPKNSKLTISNNTIYSFINIIFIAYIFTLLISFY